MSNTQYYRPRISIPTGHKSVIKWIKAQQSISTSLRVLITEQIEREGFSDITMREVHQLPRKGRPPVVASQDDDVREDDFETDTSDAEEANAQHNVVDESGELDLSDVEQDVKTPDTYVGLQNPEMKSATTSSKPVSNLAKRKASEKAEVASGDEAPAPVSVEDINSLLSAR